MSLSVIIPTYKNVEFLSELINSIERNEYNSEYEVLVGIDFCYDTLNYVYENQFPSNFKFYFFTTNGGPYIIKNTLSEITQFDKILFFDSDDMMMPQMLSEIDKNLDVFPVIKPKYINFEDVNGIRKYKEEKSQFGEGVFGIRKHLFLEMNGFEGWKVAADSDFMGRLYKTNTNILHTQSVLFHRRSHKNSLTKHPDTNLSSRIRGQYHFLSKKKNIDHIINETFAKGEYKIVDFQNKELLFGNDYNTEVDQITEEELKKIRYESISSVFSGGPKIVKGPKTPSTINYEIINNRTNHPISSKLNTALKKAKLEEIRKNSRR